MQFYTNPEREQEPNALPDAEVFNVPADVNDPEWAASNRWYWQACFPGCLPDGDPIGPFDTEALAVADAQSQAAPATDTPVAPAPDTQPNKQEHNHTPGPWRTRDDGSDPMYVTVGNEDNLTYIASVESGQNRDANARLIAAAPDLLDTLLDLLSCCELNMDDMEEDTQEACVSAQRVIADARDGDA